MKSFLAYTLSLFLFIFSLYPSQSLSLSPPKVVVSIAPFHALVAAIMEGVTTPDLLVKSGSSPHEYTLKPSEIKLLKKANIIFWAGPELEGFLVKPLSHMPQNMPITIVELMKVPHLLLLPIRQDVNFEAHSHSDHAHSHSIIDMHFWLSPENALLLVDAILDTLTTLDPSNGNTYDKNAQKLKLRLKALESKIQKTLSTITDVPFIVFHDAYQYFEHHYHLKGVGAITLHPEVPVSAKRLAQIRQLIKDTKAKCVFTEPQFQPKLVKSIVNDLQVKTAELDPVGNSIDSESYCRLLENLSTTLSTCLKE